MEKQYKTFDDLDFKQWGAERDTPDEVLELMGYVGHRQAILYFDNGYGVFVLFGSRFYSNGFDTYELAVLKDNRLVYPKSVCHDEDMLGYRTKEQITAIMKQVQDL